MKIEWELPIKTVSEMNCSEHWTAKAKRHKQQQFFVRLSYKKHVNEIKLPCSITLTRLASRFLDSDNLPASMKFLRDELSECIFPEKGGFYMTKTGKMKAKKGHGDNDPRVIWLYGQEKSKRQGVRIEIEF